MRAWWRPSSSILDRKRPKTSRNVPKISAIFRNVAPNMGQLEYNKRKGPERMFFPLRALKSLVGTTGFEPATP